MQAALPRDEAEVGGRAAAARRRRSCARCARSRREHGLAGRGARSRTWRASRARSRWWRRPAELGDDAPRRAAGRGRRRPWTGSRRCARPRARTCSATSRARWPRSRRRPARIEALTAEGKAARARGAAREGPRGLRAELGLDDVAPLPGGRAAGRPPRRRGGGAAAAQPRRPGARGRWRGGGPAGKRLDFLAQEMAREANTIGSKAASAAVVQEVVALKSGDRALPRAGAER